MKPQAANTRFSLSSSNLTQIIRKSLIIYLTAAVTVPVICFIFGWQTLEHIATGFIYGSLGVALFGVLVFAGNTVPAQISQLSIPKYVASSSSRHQDTEGDGTPSRDRAISFFFTTLLCGGFLLATGLFLKML